MAVDPTTVLIVEDEEASRRVYRHTLEGEGYRVLAARSVVEALEILEAESVDAMLLDVRMPDMHGLELLDHLRAQDRSIPTVLCTAIAKAGDSFEARSYGVSAVLTKPVDLDALRAAIREALRRNLTSARPQDGP